MCALPWCPLVVPAPYLSITFKLRIMRPRLTSRGLTLRFKMRTVSENGEIGRRETKEEPSGFAKGSGRGKGRRDMRWQRWMSFLSLCEAARECNLGVGARDDEDGGLGGTGDEEEVHGGARRVLEPRDDVSPA